MVNITKKSSTLRIAVATATVKVSKQETIDAVEQRKIPKGDVFEFARAAGLFGVKKPVMSFRIVTRFQLNIPLLPTKLWI